jgi:hypothetical protein
VLTHNWHQNELNLFIGGTQKMVSKIIRYAKDKKAVQEGKETYAFYFHPARITIRLPYVIGKMLF